MLLITFYIDCEIDALLKVLYVVYIYEYFVD